MGHRPDLCQPRRPQTGGRREGAAQGEYLLQRKESKVGDGLAKTTGWIRRTLLKKRGVTMIPGVSYERIDEAGLHISVGGEAKTLSRRHHRRLWPGRNRAAS